MKSTFIIIGIMLLTTLLTTPSCAEQPPSKYSIFYMSKNVKVLAFIGHPSSLDVTPIRLESYANQKIHLIHKKSGPGVYAFSLLGFKYKTDKGYEVMREQGYFLISKYKIRKSKYKLKTSLKHKTKE